MNDVGDRKFGATELVERIRAGDHQAEDQLIQRYGAKIEFVLRRHCRDPALVPDLYQETLIIALAALREGRLREAEKLGAFLHRTAMNLTTAEARTYQRRNTHTDQEAIEREASDFPSVSRHLEQEQLSTLIRRLLRELKKPRDQQILRRYYLSEEPKEAICAAMGVESRHFDRVLYRARQRFGELLQRYHGDFFDDY